MIARCGTGTRWLNEGMAEYIAREATGYTASSPRGSVLWDSARREVLSRALSRALEDLPATNEQWDDRFGVYPMHNQAFLAVDWLLTPIGRICSPTFPASAGIQRMRTRSATPLGWRCSPSRTLSVRRCERRPRWH